MADYWEMTDYMYDLGDWLEDWEEFLRDMMDAYDADGSGCWDCEDYLDNLQDWLDDYYDYLESLYEEMEEWLREAWEDYLEDLLDSIDDIDERQEWIDKYIDDFIEDMLDFMSEEEKIKYCKTGELPDDIQAEVQALLEHFDKEYNENEKLVHELLDAFDDAADIFWEMFGEDFMSMGGPARNSAGSSSGSYGAAQNMLRLHSGILKVSSSAASAATRQNEVLAKIF